MDIKINMNNETGKQALDVINSMGFSIENVLSDYLNYIARTKTIIPPNAEPSEFLINSIEASDKEFSNGNYKKINHLSDLITKLK